VSDYRKNRSVLSDENRTVFVRKPKQRNVVTLKISAVKAVEIRGFGLRPTSDFLFRKSAPVYKGALLAFSFSTFFGGELSTQ
jgi:hypothetical protein